GGEQQAVVGPAEAAVGGDPTAGDLEEVDLLAVLDHPDAVLDGGRHVVAALGVEAEAVARALAEHLDDPLPRAVGVEALQAGPFDDDEVALEVEGDAVAVEEPVGDDPYGTVALLGHHPPR